MLISFKLIFWEFLIILLEIDSLKVGWGGYVKGDKIKKIGGYWLYSEK